MNQLSNYRWLAIPSENLGEDWLSKSHEIDQVLQNQGLELLSQDVFLIFNQGPGAILNHEGQCLVARSVVGPKKEFLPPFRLIDWVSAPVHRFELGAKTWEEAFHESFDLWQKLIREGKKLSEGFFLFLKKRENEGLELSLEAIFKE